MTQASQVTQAKEKRIAEDNLLFAANGGCSGQETFEAAFAQAAVNAVDSAREDRVNAERVMWFFFNGLKEIRS